MKLDEMTRKFVLSEGSFKEPTLRSYIQALEESLNKIQTKSMSESRRLEIAKEQLKGVRRQARRLEEAKDLLESQNRELNERLNILEENKTEKSE